MKIPEIDEETPGISDDMYKLALALMRSAKGIDKTPDAEAGSILVFLPGIYEIGRMRTVITDYLEGYYKYRIAIISLMNS